MLDGQRSLRLFLWVLLANLSVLSSTSYSADNSADNDLHFSAAQVAQGHAAYIDQCYSCHGVGLDGVGVVPSLYGDDFRAKWGGQSLASLVDAIQTMPPESPGSLSQEMAVSFAAFLLQFNGIQAEDTALSTDPELLIAITIPLLQSGTTLFDYEPLPVAEAQALLSALVPVTAADLLSPPDADWLGWRRTQDAQGFSPLSQINAENVGQLQLEWQVPLPEVNGMPTPLIRNGVMFVYVNPDTLFALDASSGQLLWKYQHPLTRSGSRKMGIALHNDAVIIPTSDFRIVALSAQTGEPLWNQQVDASPYTDRIPYSFRGAPLIAGDKIIQGVNGSRVPGGGFIVALDAETGEEAWRFYTIPKPGEIGGDSWNGQPWNERSGGAVWHNGTFDPQLNLVYFGASSTYDTEPLRVPVDEPGISNDALFTNATLALEKDTGELVWYFQHMHNDQYDLDWVFERQLTNLTVDGIERRVVMTTGKIAITDVLDAATGEFLFSLDSGLQNLIDDIDDETGRKTKIPAMMADPEVTKIVCPSLLGARNWPGLALNPHSKTLFLPLTDDCMEAGPQGITILSSGIGVRMIANPDRPDNNMALIQAIDLEREQIKWSRRWQTPFVSSALATQSGLLFIGDIDPSLKAFDQETGDLLWQIPLENFPNSGLITYAVEGRQYIAVIVGQRSNNIRDRNREYLLAMDSVGEPVMPPNTFGSYINVYALPNRP